MFSKRSVLLTALSFLLNISAVHAQWVQTNGLYNEPIWSMTSSDTVLLAGSHGGGVYLSTNYGTKWDTINSGLTDHVIRALAISPNGNGGLKFFAGTETKGVFLSSNRGATWSATNSGLTDLRISALLASPRSDGTGRKNLLTGTFSGVFLSTDDGTTWRAVNSGLTNTSITVLASATVPGVKDSTILFAGTEGGGIFVSTNDGSSWTDINSNLPNLNMRSIAIALPSAGSGSLALFAGTLYGAHLSTNMGASWSSINIGLTNNNVFAVIVVPPSVATGGINVFAGTFGGGVFVYGRPNWKPVNTGLNSWYVNSLAVCGKYLFAGTSNLGVWKRPLDEIVTSTPTTMPDVPSTFVLEQNYPNPFNPSTTIRYLLPHSEFATLKIFNVLGQQVATLVSGNISAGTHQVEWNAPGIPTGAYFYRLETTSFSQTRILLLLR